MKQSYMKRFFLHNEESALQEGAFEMSKDITEMLNKYHNADIPLLLACVKMAIPQIENICGEEGVSLADELCKRIICVGREEVVE